MALWNEDGKKSRLYYECACGYNKAEKKKKEQRASLSYFFVHCLRWDRREKNVPCKPRPDHSKCSSQAILWGKNNTTLSARCACVCAQTLSRRNKVREKSVADTLATTTRRALTRSWLVRQVSSVLPLTAGKTEMAPWANLRGSFTTRDNVHVACLHHSHPSFPRHSKKNLGNLPRIEKEMKKQWPGKYDQLAHCSTRG